MARGNRRARTAHVERTYGVPPAALEALERHQWVEAGGAAADWEPGVTLCWGCRRATGASKNLAMDHDHRTGEARMLLCSVCNHDVLGHYRDRPLDLLRLALALVDPPSRVAWTGLNLAPPTWHTKDPGALLWIECRLQGAEGCT